MAEIKDNDEYEFAELDGISPSMAEDNLGESEANSDQRKKVVGAPDVRRNALIAVGIVILLILIYKFIVPFFTKSSPQAPKNMIAAPKVTTPAPVPHVEPPKPVVTEAIPAPTVTGNTEINQKLSVLDLNQQNIRSEIDNLNNQLGLMNSNINALGTKIASLSQNMALLSTKLEQQSLMITKVTTIREKPRRIQPIIKRQIVQPTAFYIQAVIPGRAWLISSNGSTLTVREGTSIKGYGIVKLIDPNQGRVITSSGRIIRFSQQDS